MDIEHATVRPDRARATRNGLPSSKPYSYRGTGESLHAPSEIAERVRHGRPAPPTPAGPPLRAPSRQQAEASTRALMAIDTEVPAGPPRCDACRYLLTWCCCPGGPRGGAPC